MQLTTTTINTGMTFSDGIISFRENHNKNLFEKIITINTIEEDENLSTTEKENLINILNSNINPFEKRLRIMRSLDKEKDFSSKIAMVLRKKPTKMEMVKEILKIQFKTRNPPRLHSWQDWTSELFFHRQLQPNSETFILVLTDL